MKNMAWTLRRQETAGSFWKRDRMGDGSVANLRRSACHPKE
jgi:hypothetical protein